jgi:16S rRNA (uracil1498-N3)-methyltransferase
VRLPRIHIPDLPDAAGAEVPLEGDEATHLLRVLRLKPGARVVGFDGRGASRTLSVVVADRRRCTLEVVGEGTRDPALPFALTLAVGTPKGKRAHRLVEALTEVGVHQYRPLLAARSVGRPPDPEQARRWALEACKQCGRNTVMRVGAACTLGEALALGADQDLILVPDTTGAAPLREVIASWKAPPARVLGLIGPEGGFTAEERASFAEAEARVVSLAPAVLRIETAAVALACGLAQAWA